MTAAGLGIRSLTVALCVSLVIVTGVLTTSLTITTSNDLIDSARATGDKAVQDCLHSGEADLRMIAGSYLDGIVGRMEESTVRNYLEGPDMALQELAFQAQAVDPSISTSPNYIDTTIRQVLRARMETLVPRGLEMIGFFPANGPELLFFLSTAKDGPVLPLNGSRPVLIAESRNGTDFLPSRAMWLGDSGVTRELLHLGKTCNPFTNYPAGEVVGVCPIPRGFVVTPFVTDVLERGAAAGADAPLNTVVYSPVEAYQAHLVYLASITFTHPSTGNTPLGSFVIGVEGEGLEAVFAQQVLPTGSLLYAVDRNPWTREVGTVVATNKGRAVNYQMTNRPPGSRLWVPTPFRIHILNHTVVQNSTTMSTIGEHGQHVFTMEQNYTTLVNNTKNTFAEWTSKENSTLYWVKASRLTRSNMQIFVVLLVPRSSVMDEIDASNERIRKEFEADKTRSDDKQARSIIMMLCVTVSVVVVLLLLAVVLTRLIVSPLIALAGDMANVAVMDLEAVNLESPPSRRGEVSQMQQSFRQMVRNLMEYRNYMPQSVLVKDTDDETTEEATERLSTGSRSLRSVARVPEKTNSEEHSGSGNGSSLAALRKAAGFGDHTLKKRPVTLTQFNLREWHKHIARRQQEEVQVVHMELISIMLTAVQAAKGVCDNFSGDRLLGTFNAYAPLATHRAAGVAAAMQARGRIEAYAKDSAKTADAPSLSFAVCAGDSRVGHLGCSGLKKVTIVSSVMTWVAALERYNRAHNLTGLTDHNVFREARTQYEMKCKGAIQFTKRSDDPIRVYEAVKLLREISGEEWMYQMQALEGASDYTQWNTAYEQLLAGDWDAARVALRGVPAFLSEEAAAMDKVAMMREFKPDEILFH